MCKTGISLESFMKVIVLVVGLGLSSLAQAANPTPIAWWKFDGDALDSSGNERNGTLHGNPQWIPGVYGEALAFDGDDTVTIDGYKGVLGTQAFTITAWIRADTDGEIIGWGSSGDGNRAEFRVNGGRLRYESGGGNVQGDTTVSDSTWHHVATTIPANAQYVDVTIYLDGQEDTQPEGDTDVVHPLSNFDAIMGQRYNRGGRWYTGAIDDLRIYDVVLTLEEIREVMAGLGPITASASEPSPENDSTDVPRDVVLSWTPGESAPAVNGHTLYFNEDFNDVSDGMGGLIQSANSYTPPQRLDFGKTYYWRVDEVNAPPDSTVFQGDVWQFTVEHFSIPIDNITATASSSFDLSVVDNTINGSGLVDDLHGTSAGNMWISAGVPATIEYAFDRAYKLHELWIWNSNQVIETFVGFGAKDVVIEHSLDGEAWTVLEGVGPLAQAPGTKGYAHNNTIDFGGARAQHVRMTINSVQGIAPQASLSEVRFYYIPTFATRPNPAPGATDVAPDVTLSWGRAGREVDRHEIYLGSDANDLPLVGSVGASSFDTLALDLQLSQGYHWRVDEVNEAMDPSHWPSDIWSFTTAGSVVVDDMESYKDEEFLEIWATWIDGFDDPANGALVGADPAIGDFASETDTVRGGRQALPLWYDNTAAPTSEAARTFASAQDWTRAGVQGLVLYFYGDPENVPGQLYVRVNNTKVLYDGDLETLQRVGWQKWYIPLTDHFSSNELARVQSMSIGIEGGGAGVLLVDDISLTADSRVLMTPVEPTADNLVAHYAFDGDTSDMTGVHPGAAPGLSTFETGKFGQALSLAGVFGDYVEITGYKGILGSSAITVTGWINTSATDTGTIIGWGPGAPDGGRFGFRVNANRIRCEFSGGNVQGRTVVNDGDWHHVAVTVKANATISYPDVTLWVDGLDDTQPSIDETVVNILAHPDRDARIGSRPSDDDRLFNGLIDELSLYDRALTAEEIAGAAGRVAPFDL